jgi:hypothetical protein
MYVRTIGCGLAAALALGVIASGGRAQTAPAPSALVRPPTALERPPGPADPGYVWVRSRVPTALLTPGAPYLPNQLLSPTFGGAGASAMGGISGGDLPIQRTGTLLDRRAHEDTWRQLPVMRLERQRQRPREFVLQVRRLQPGTGGKPVGDADGAKTGPLPDPRGPKWFREGLSVDCDRDRFAVSDPYVKAAVEEDRRAEIEELTPLDIASEALWIGDWKAAEAALQAHMKDHPIDWDVSRVLALVLLANRQAAQGVAVMAQAYEQDPTLAERAIDVSTFKGGATKVRELFNAAFAHAQRVKSGSAFLTAAVIAQAEGRPEVARRIVSRGLEFGLDPKLGGTVMAALGEPAAGGTRRGE